MVINLYEEQVTIPTLQCYKIHATEKAAGMGITIARKTVQEQRYNAFLFALLLTKTI